MRRVTVVLVIGLVTGGALLAATPREELAAVAAIDGNLVVTGVAGSLKDVDALADRIAGIAGVRAVVPTVEGLALVSTSGEMTGLLFRGLRVADVAKIPFLAADATPDSLQVFGAAPGIAVGAVLSRRLGFNVGDTVMLAFAGAGRKDDEAPRIETRRFTVALVFDSGVANFDDNVIFMPRAQVEAGLDGAGTVAQLLVYLDDPFDFARVKAVIGRDAAETVRITDWRERHQAAVRRMEHGKE